MPFTPLLFETFARDHVVKTHIWLYAVCLKLRDLSQTGRNKGTRMYVSTTGTGSIVTVFCCQRWNISTFAVAAFGATSLERWTCIGSIQPRQPTGVQQMPVAGWVLFEHKEEKSLFMEWYKGLYFLCTAHKGRVFRLALSFHLKS